MVNDTHVRPIFSCGRGDGGITEGLIGDVGRGLFTTFLTSAGLRILILFNLPTCALATSKLSLGFCHRRERGGREEGEEMGRRGGGGEKGRGKRKGRIHVYAYRCTAFHTGFFLGGECLCVGKLISWSHRPQAPRGVWRHAPPEKF